MSLFTDDMIIYVESPKESMQKLLEIISDCSKAAGYQVSIQKTIAFVHTNNEQVDFDIKTQLEPPKNKYLGINLTKYIQDVYEENYKTLVNKIRVK